MYRKSKKNLKIFIGIISLFLFFTSVLLFQNFDFGATNINKESTFDKDINHLSPSLSKEWNRTWGTVEGDISNKIAIDGDGNAYVVGTSGDPSDAVIVKYDEEGIKIWNVSFNGLDGNSEMGKDVAISPDEKYVYLAGYTYLSGGEYHMLLIKYNATDGTEIWNRTWTGINRYSFGYSVVVNSSGYIFLGGHDGWNWQEVNIILYNESGANLKNQTVSFSDYNYFSDMSIDSNDDLYITGSNSTSGTLKRDTFIAKFDSSLIQKWNRTFSAECFNLNKANPSSITCDSKNNIYIAGYVGNSSNGVYKWHLMKYTSNGNHMFNKTVIQHPSDDDSDRSPFDICVDIYGNSYLIGAANGTNFLGDYDLLIVKCDESGDYNYNWTWDSGEVDKGRGITFNPKGYLLACGNQQNFNIGPEDSDIVILNYSLKPQPFSLVIEEVSPTPHDGDGNIILNWEENAPIDADNYTIYNSSTYISEINASINKTAEGITDTSFAINGLKDGNYYYIIEANNAFGKSISDCREVTVGRTPGDFIVTENSTRPHDSDGLFWLNWSTAPNAEFYSIFYDTSEISNYDAANIYKKGVSATQIEINMSSMGNGVWYFIIVANNTFDGGYAETQSLNIINVTLGMAPSSFTLSSSDGGDPDQDGQFTLTWTASRNADNYSLYMSTSQIIDVNDPGVQLIYNGSETSFEITEAEGLMDDIYYFKLVAKNQFGSDDSNTFSITVGTPTSSGLGGRFPWWLQAIFTGIISASAGLVIKISYSRYKRRKELMNKISDQLDKIDNIEQFLKDKLGFKEWQKLQEPLNQYQKQVIDQRDLIKMAKKELGDRFMELFKAK